VAGRVSVGTLVCSGPARAERRGCWARAAAKAQGRGQSQGGGGRGRSGAGSVVYKMRRAVRTRGVLLDDRAIRRLAAVQPVEYSHSSACSHDGLLVVYLGQSTTFKFVSSRLLQTSCTELR
jgi:hypothetical protein